MLQHARDEICQHVVRSGFAHGLTKRRHAANEDEQPPVDVFIRSLKGDAAGDHGQQSCQQHGDGGGQEPEGTGDHRDEKGTEHHHSLFPVADAVAVVGDDDHFGLLFE